MHVQTIFIAFFLMNMPAHSIQNYRDRLCRHVHRLSSHHQAMQARAHRLVMVRNISVAPAERICKHHKGMGIHQQRMCPRQQGLHTRPHTLRTHHPSPCAHHQGAHAPHRGLRSLSNWPAPASQSPCPERIPFCYCATPPPGSIFRPPRKTSTRPPLIKLHRSESAPSRLR